MRRTRNDGKKISQLVAFPCIGFDAARDKERGRSPQGSPLS
jgi:hypothetical protein